MNTMKSNINIGIEKIAAYVPEYYITMEQLSKHRNIPLEKLTKGLLQEKMSIPSYNQDIISMAVNASHQILTKEDKQLIDLVIFSTESSFDHSKASSITLSSLLKINANARCVEIKQACQSTASGLSWAYEHLQLYPNKKVLLVSSDIAKYEPETAAESSQGAGAIAMLISTNPKILKLNNDQKIWHNDIFDFYRPINYPYPIVDGPLSKDAYLTAIDNVFDNNKKYDALLFHTPYPKLVYKALEHLKLKDYANLKQQLDQALIFNKVVGNIYTGSLYLSLISLLINSNLTANSTIGFFSYGSGCVAEMFSGKLLPNYKDYLLIDYHQNLINNRKQLTFNNYLKYMHQPIPTNKKIKTDNHNYCQLKIIKNYQREYLINE